MSPDGSPPPATTARARPMSTQSFLSRSASARRFRGLFSDTHSRTTSDSKVYTPPTRRDSITPQSIPLNGANVRPPSTDSNARPLSTASNEQPFSKASNEQPFSEASNEEPLSAASNAGLFSTASKARPPSTVSDTSTVSGTIPFPDFDSSFEPPREDGEIDTDDSDHGSQEGGEDAEHGNENDELRSDAPLHRLLFSKQDLAEMSEFYGVTATNRGRLSFDFGDLDDEPFATEGEIPVQEDQNDLSAWQRKLSRSTNSTRSGARQSMMGSIGSSFSARTGTPDLQHSSAMKEQDIQGIRDSVPCNLAHGIDIPALQSGDLALFNQESSNSNLGSTPEHSTAMEVSSVAPSVTSTMYSRRFEHILGPGIRDSWLSGLFTTDFGQWKQSEGEEEELEPKLEPAPICEPEPEPTPEPEPEPEPEPSASPKPGPEARRYPEFDEDTSATIISFLETLGRDTQLVNRRLKHVLAEWKWVGISVQHGLIYIRKPDTFYDEVVFIHDKLGQHIKDLQEQLVAIKGFDVGFDDTLRSCSIDEREPKDVVTVVEMYEVKYKDMMEDFAARKLSIMQEIVGEKKRVLVPKVEEMKKAMEKDLAAKKKDFMRMIKQKIAVKNQLKDANSTDEQLVDERLIFRLQAGARWLGRMICQIQDEMVTESVADTESEWEPYSSSEEVEYEVSDEGEAEMPDEGEAELSGTENEIIQSANEAHENWSDLDEYESTDADSESSTNGSHENGNSEDDGWIDISEDESNEYDSDADSSSDDESEDNDNDGEESSEDGSSEQESSDEEDMGSVENDSQAELLSEQWASGVREARQNGVVFKPSTMTVQESQEIVLKILRARWNVKSTLTSE